MIHDYLYQFLLFSLFHKENLEELREVLESIPWEGEYAKKKVAEKAKADELKEKMKNRKSRMPSDYDDNEEESNDETQQKEENSKTEQEEPEMTSEEIIRKEDEERIRMSKEAVEKIEL